MNYKKFINILEREIYSNSNLIEKTNKILKLLESEKDLLFENDLFRNISNYEELYNELDFKKLLLIFTDELHYDDVNCVVTLDEDSLYNDILKFLFYHHFPVFKLLLLLSAIKTDRIIQNFTLKIFNKNAPFYRINRLKPQTINKFIRTSGIIKRVSIPTSICKYATFICMQCDNKIQRLQPYNDLVLPFCKKCQNKEKMKIDEINSKYIDFQIIELQELQQNIQKNEQYKTLICLLYNTFTNKFAPGQIVNINGLLQIEDLKQNINTYVLEVYNIQQKSRDLDSEIPETKFKEFAAEPKYWSYLENLIAKNIWGHQEIKSGLLLQLFEGCNKTLPNKVSLRGNIHVLLIGDPGTAKSQFLRLINTISEGILTSATSSTAAGLTSIAIKDEKTKKWTVEAGALALANQKIVCIDELDKIKISELYSLHEAMQQQTISVAKAGIVLTLNAKTSILASANPKLGRFNEREPLDAQLNLPITLLSRFDLIFMLKDVAEEERDKEISEYILNVHKRIDITKEEEYDFSFLKQYIKYAKKLQPRLTEVAIKTINEYYVNLRKNSKHGLLITTRQLETLVRLSEAKSKSRLGEYITEDDAIFAIKVFNSSLYKTANSEMFDLDMAETGFSKKEKDIINILTTLIKSRPKITLDEIIEELHSFPKQKILEILKKLKSRGYVYEPEIKKYELI